MRLDTCRASPQVVAAGGMASSVAREPVEDPASKVLITSSVADQMSVRWPGPRFCIRNGALGVLNAEPKFQFKGSNTPSYPAESVLVGVRDSRSVRAV
jgi:hypothetical protein